MTSSFQSARLQFNRLCVQWLELNDIYHLNHSEVFGDWNWRLCDDGLGPDDISYYLVMEVDSINISAAGGDAMRAGGEKSEFTDMSCAMDDVCSYVSTPTASDSQICPTKGSIHIILHPTYLVPCFYVSLRKLDGTDMHVSDWWSLADAGLIPDEHPILGTPFATLHPCGTLERLDCMKSVSDTSHDNQQCDPLYMLKWFAFAGKEVGLPLSPDFYTAAEKRLMLLSDTI